MPTSSWTTHALDPGAPEAPCRTAAGAPPLPSPADGPAPDGGQSRVHDGARGGSRQREGSGPSQIPQTSRASPSRYDYVRYSTLAGPLTDVAPRRTYRVGYRRLVSDTKSRMAAGFLIWAGPLMSAALLGWLVMSSRVGQYEQASSLERALDAALLVSVAAIELFRLLNVVSNAHATLVARDPVPVRPAGDLKVAFATTFVPGKEPLAMLRATLEAAVAVRYEGQKDVWLLDEGDDPAAKALCEELGVHHFTRKGVEKWNRGVGLFRARTKHGNYNAWLDVHGLHYDVMASVDTDHVPLPNFLERMLGYFRDPDVAFVVGPQVYGNYEGWVTKAAESQQFLFHSVIQRAGNAYGSPMLVGTNNCIRLSALQLAGGLADSITEDMATGLEMHGLRNPRTGRRWISVYTPDVLAVGEGPETWTDYFTQQLRWSRGTYETLAGRFWRTAGKLSPGRLLNYGLMVIYYPMAAMNWALSAVACLLFLGLGASGFHGSPTVWFMLYADASALQIGLYLWNRRHNVSPHEPKGSAGVAGMAMSVVCAPIYARSLTDTVLRRPSRFVVTPKGGSMSNDSFKAFHIHLMWGAVFALAVAVSLRSAPALTVVHVWAAMALCVTTVPVLMWVRGEFRARRAAAAARAAIPVRAEPVISD